MSLTCLHKQIFGIYQEIWFYKKTVLSFCFHGNGYDATLFESSEYKKQIPRVIFDHIGLPNSVSVGLYFDTAFMSLASLYRTHYISNVKHPGAVHFGVFKSKMAARPLHHGTSSAFHWIPYTKEYQCRLFDCFCSLNMARYINICHYIRLSCSLKTC